MPTLTKDQYAAAYPLFENVSQFHLCGWAVLHGTASGEVWLDDVDHPHAGVIQSYEGCYLAGDSGDPRAYKALKEVIPHFAYLICDPPGWEGVLPQVWSNPAYRPHEREHYLFTGPALPPVPTLPEGFRLLPVDADFFSACTGFENFDTAVEWVNGWPSREAYDAHGAGAVIVQGEIVASMSVMDCALGDRCEIGVITDARFRRMGLGKQVVRAVLEMCLNRGYREVGWQCLSNNHGSAAIARGLGFRRERVYKAFSSFLPAESSDNLTKEQYADWAAHYERLVPDHLWCGFQAAQAWAMAGRTDRAVEHLHRLVDGGWQARPEWVEENWTLEGLKENEEAQALLKALIK